MHLHNCTDSKPPAAAATVSPFPQSLMESVATEMEYMYTHRVREPLFVLNCVVNSMESKLLPPSLVGI